MKVILHENIAKIGKKGNVVEVSDGYALNFLIPRNKAVFANEEAIIQVTSEHASQSQKKTEELVGLECGVKELDGKTVTLSVVANEQGHLFAAVHRQDIGNAVNDQFNVELPSDAFLLPGEIKATGDYDIVATAGKVKAKLKLSIKSESK